MPPKHRPSSPEAYGTPDPRTLQRLDEMFDIEEPPRRERVSARTRRGKVVSRFVDTRILSAAMELADNDTSRLIINGDGSVSVANNPQ